MISHLRRPSDLRGIVSRAAEMSHKLIKEKFAGDLCPHLDDLHAGRSGVKLNRYTSGIYETIVRHLAEHLILHSDRLSASKRGRQTAPNTSAVTSSGLRLV